MFAFLTVMCLQATSQDAVDLKRIKNKISHTNKPLSQEISVLKFVSAKSADTCFYLSSHQVTIEKYRQFLEYIQDSVLRKLMGYVKQGADWNEYIDYSKKITAKDIIVMEKFDGPPEPIFLHTGKVMHLRPKSFVYSYKVENKWIQIPVMPDTSFWNYADSSLISRTEISDYLWLSAYDHYTITGVNFQQAQAYCYWKTKELKNALGTDCEVTVSLPTASQWEVLLSNQLKVNANKAIDEAAGFWYTVSFKKKKQDEQ